MTHHRFIPKLDPTFLSEILERVLFIIQPINATRCLLQPKKRRKIMRKFIRAQPALIQIRHPHIIIGLERRPAADEIVKLSALLLLLLHRRGSVAAADHGRRMVRDGAHHVAYRAQRGVPLTRRV